MLVQLKAGLEFVSKDNETRFKIIEYNYYGFGDILCASTEKSIYPLREIYLSHYNPVRDGVVINEPNDYYEIMPLRR